MKRKIRALKNILIAAIAMAEIIVSFISNTNTVYASNLLTYDQFTDAINGVYEGGGRVFRIKEDIEIYKSKGEEAPYHYFTRGKTATSNIRHRTIGIQISRVRDDVENPLVDPWVSNKKITPNRGDDPHYYYEVTDEMRSDGRHVMFNDPWESYTTGGVTYARQYFTILISDIERIINGTIDHHKANGYTIDDWVIPYDSMWNQIKYSVGCDGWYESLQKKKEAGEGYAFAVDNVKTLNYVVGGNDNLHAEGWTYTQEYVGDDGKPYKGYYYVDYNNNAAKKLTSSTVVWTWANYQTAPKSNGHGITTSMIKDYYWKYYYEGATVPVSEIETPDSVPTKSVGKFNLVKNETDGGAKTTNTGNASGSNTTTDQAYNAYASPGIFTYNDSDTYELGKAIPTSNSFTNGIVMDGWYGNVEITQNHIIQTHTTSNYKINYSYKVTRQGEEPIYDGEGRDTGETRKYSYTEDKGGTYYGTEGTKVQSTWQGIYYAITGANLYQLQSAYTTNEAYGTQGYSTNILTHVPYSITVNGTNYTSGSAVDGSEDQRVSTFTEDTNYHIKYNTVDESLITVSVDLGTDPSGDLASKAYNAGIGQVQTIWHQRVKDRSNLYTMQNDEFTIDGVTYLTNPANVSQDANGVWQKGGNQYWTYVKDGLHEMSEATTNNIKQDQATVSIPSNVMNGYYHTNVSATYKSFIEPAKKSVPFEIKDCLSNNTTTSVHEENYDGAFPAILRSGGLGYAYAKANYDYAVNEPVVVHTPVIAPITITDGESTTQLINKAGMSVSQLVLDHNYTVHFDWHSYFSDLLHYKGYDAPAGWLKYINQKYVAFPFNVYVGGVNYDVHSDGYTNFIPLGTDTEYFDFYIPSWSQEGLYYDPNGTIYSTYDSIPRPIKVKVLAENIDFGLEDYTELNYNSNKKNYTATFNYPCQVSGILYDFQVVSVYDKTNWATADWIDEFDAGIFNFVRESERTGKLQAEKNVGRFNRLGLAYMRYTLDGDMTTAWSWANTLPFAKGKSVYGSENAGYLVKGNTIGFTVKTIANLTGKNSYIKITPNYRYYGNNGINYESSQLDVYYSVDGDNFVKMGSEKDLKNRKTVSLQKGLAAAWFDKSYFDYYYDTFKSTAKHKSVLWNDSDISTSYVAKGKTKDSYCLGDIKIDQGLCLWTGNEEELQINLDNINNASQSLRYVDTDEGWGDINHLYNDLAFHGGYNYLNVGNTVEYKDYWSFESSMQTWYGLYTIPSSIKVCPHGSLEAWVNNYGYVDGTESFWLEDGDLVLNFDIRTYREGDNPHLQYYGNVNSTNMWSTEKTGSSGAPDPDPDDRPGDVGEIDLTKASVAKHKNIGHLYMN